MVSSTTVGLAVAGVAIVGATGAAYWFLATRGSQMLSVVFPSTVKGGQSVSWSAKGITRSGPYAFSLPFFTSDITGNADAQGMASGTFTVPYPNPGNYQGVFKDTTTQKFVLVNFVIQGSTLTPQVQVVPPAVIRGSLLAWVATGFDPNATLQVGTGVVTQFATTNSSGAAAGSYDTTPLTPSDYQFQVIEVISVFNPTSVQPPVFAHANFTVLPKII